MNCIEFETAAERAVETRQPASAMMLEHQSTCSDCRQAWERQRQLDGVIAAWKSVRSRVDLADAVLDQLSRPDTGFDWDSDLPNNSEHYDSEHGLAVVPSSRTLATSRRASRSGLLVLGASAACLAIAILFTAFNSSDPHQLASRSQPVPNQRIHSDVSLDMSTSLTSVISDLQSEYRDVASETTAMAREMVDGITQPVEMSSLTTTDAVDLRPISKDVGRMLQPIGDGVESAFGFLWQALPREIPAG
jgi:hypothetical protein